MRGRVQRRARIEGESEHLWELIKARGCPRAAPGPSNAHPRPAPCVSRALHPSSVHSLPRAPFVCAHHLTDSAFLQERQLVSTMHLSSLRGMRIGIEAAVWLRKIDAKEPYQVREPMISALAPLTRRSGGHGRHPADAAEEHRR